MAPSRSPAPCTNSTATLPTIRWCTRSLLWVFIVFPVYALAMFVDFVVLNLIEFWSGEPIEISSTTTSDGSTIIIGPGEEADTAFLMIRSPAGEVNTLHFHRGEDLVTEVRNDAGETIGWVIPQGDRTFDLADADRRVVRTLRGDEIALALAERTH